MDVVNDALDPLMTKLEDMENLVKSLKVRLGNAEVKLAESNNNIFELLSKQQDSESKGTLALERVEELSMGLKKCERSIRIREALERTNMADESVELVLKEVAALQDKIGEDMNHKLRGFLAKPDFNDFKLKHDTIARRLGKAESEIEDIGIKG